MTRRHLRGRYAAGVRLAVAGLRNVELSIVLVGVLLTVCPRAFALNPALDVSQYAHTAWKIRDGFTKGTIGSIAQTPDGYLWLGTEFGLYRFDGVRAAPWQPPPDQQLPSTGVMRLLVARDGTLWIGTLKGLASWKDGKLMHYPELGGRYIYAIVEDHGGTIWASGFSSSPYDGRLCAIQHGNVKCFGEDGSLGKGAFNLYVDSRGNLWAGVKDGLWRWRPGPPRFYPLPGEPNGIQGLAEDADGMLLIGWKGGIHKLVQGRSLPYTLPRPVPEFYAFRMLRDRDGGLWVGPRDQGLLHVHQGRADVFVPSDGLSGEFVLSFFEDREGSIWIATNGGLDRFRDVAVSTFSVSQGLSKATVGSVLADRDGSVWIATYGGLNRWKNGQITVTPTGSAKRDGKLNGEVPQSVFQDAGGRLWVSTYYEFGYLEQEQFVSLQRFHGGSVLSIVEDRSGDLWVDQEQEGLFHISHERVTQKFTWASQGHNDHVSVLAADSVQGGLWLGFHNGGVAYFKDGQVRVTYTAADGLGAGRVDDFWVEPDGTLWASTEGGLSRIRNGRVATLTGKNGLPCDAVHWSKEDNGHSVWLYTGCGLLRIARAELNAWAAVADKDVAAKAALNPTVFENSDGVRIQGSGHYHPQVAKSADGKLWFALADGVSVVDPAHLPLNKLPPPVYIEQITADRKTYDPAAYGKGHVSLPARIRDLEVDYTALSLVAPEKIRFRYKLEGRDSDWQDAGNRRQAFYSDLPPRTYRFRVMACNNSGVWNEAGAFLDFSVAPAYYQTIWFRLSLVAALVALLWGLYQLRLRQLAREYDIRVEERVGERTRIARELHDSLLQGFQGLIFRFQAAREFLPGRPNEATEALDIALKRADKVIVEGRDTVSDLRQSVMEDSDIGQALTALGEELAAQSDNGSAPCVRVLVEGKQRDLNPMLRDEIYRIGREALRNAFRHARAQKIEAEITYGDSEFVFHVRDDGIGIPPEFADHGTRPGHWGLPGMRERAKNFGGKLEVWSEIGAGTEIELTIPAAFAYVGSNARPRFWFLRKRKKSQAIDGHKS